MTHRFPKAYADQVAKLRVPSGFILVLAFAWLSLPTPRSLLLGTPIALIGLTLRAWAAGNLTKDRELTTQGPYSLLRNPLYLGTLLVGIGFVFASRSFVLGLVFAAVFAFIYLPAIELEEQHLRSLFPGFTEYAARVPRLFPSFHITAATRHFRCSLYRKNREYQAAFGFSAGLIWLVTKTCLAGG
ncbi:MAG: isoprenylcysteine carboxylmethyltransferase family protein [Acidobacteriota bacterium]|nr:isoprenylcysteine carboxylmethyltransferase family protein [Acidobacteriota bacterium]